MKTIKNLFYLLAFYLITFSTVSAHVKWFVDSDKVLNNPYEGTIYDLDSTPVLIWIGVVIAMVLLGIYLDKIIKTPKNLKEFSIKYEKKINDTAQFLLGVFMLVTMNFFWDTIIVPKVDPTNTFKYIVQVVQVVIGGMFMFNFYPRIASVLLGAFTVGLFGWSGPVVFLENLILLALAVYFFIKNSKATSKTFSFNKHALKILRIGTGISLIVLAFTEKLAYPELSLAFLEAHPWNFMQPIFPSFNDSLFILSVGASEVIFGIMFILGYLTRVATIFLAIFLVSSATAMFLSVGDWEAGHIMVYAAAIVFLAFGSGREEKGPTKIS